MTNTPLKRANRRVLTREGTTVDLYNYTESSANRAEVWSQTGSSPHTISARVDLRNTPRPSRDVRETGDVEVDARIHIADDASGVSNIRDGGGQGASTIDVDRDGTEDYRVLKNFDPDNGLLRLDCELI